MTTGQRLVHLLKSVILSALIGGLASMAAVLFAIVVSMPWNPPYPGEVASAFLAFMIASAIHGFVAVMLLVLLPIIGRFLPVLIRSKVSTIIVSSLLGAALATGASYLLLEAIFSHSIIADLIVTVALCLLTGGAAAGARVGAGVWRVVEDSVGRLTEQQPRYR